MTTVPDLSGNTGGVDAEFAPERDGTPAYPYSITFSTSQTGVKTSANSLSVTPASDANFPVTARGVDATNAVPTVNPVYVSYLVSSGVPAYTNGRVAPGTLTLAGELITATGGIGTNASDGAGVGVNLLVSRDGTARIGGTGIWTWNGTGYDRVRKPNGVKRVASSAASGSPDFAKASAGDLTKVSGLNTTAAIIYFHVYNKATAPTIGTDTPIFSYPINVSERFDISIPNGGLYCSTGIAYAFTTDIATVPTTGTAAATVTALALTYA